MRNKFVSFFLLNDQLRVFLPELFDRWQLGSSSCVEGFLRRLVKRDLCPMLLKELFAVTGLPVGNIHIPRFGVIDDMGL